ncbi:HKD family nuclease [Inhella inkyongensis]|uniref:HKD family nuclease n=1 Tax=Inhella inkyongensis TaxID=392593 RepID=A0A840RVZ1_9BURK|nr:phospholipase D family protein [Inhella inkyongensis]MBB5202837.1 HKD family nuclease [Inhella inkyongensis]
MFVAQPSQNFGNLVSRELISRSAGQLKWNYFQFAVAWLNRAGARKIHESLNEFLAENGRIRATVGLDFGSTTYEGLKLLLDLEDRGVDITTNVFHDENPACTFHPKIFLFENDVDAHLFVGSNNMTGAGLETNIEAALGFCAKKADKTITEARLALEAWRDDSTESRTRRLDQVLLEQLRDRGYVLTEAELRARRQTDAKSKSAKGAPLFGRSKLRTRVGGLGTPGAGAGSKQTAIVAIGDILLARIRPRRDRRQIQISMLLHSSFMKSTDEVIAPDGSRKAIGYNYTNGVKNTARFEAPEMITMKNPVARFWWAKKDSSGNNVKKALHYQIYDADSDPTGKAIYKELESGIGKSAITNLKKLGKAETVLSKSDKTIAQWYRISSIQA